MPMHGMFMGGNTSVNQYINALPYPQQGSSGAGALRSMGTVAGGLFSISDIMSAGRQRQRDYRAQIENLARAGRAQERQDRRVVSQQRAAFGAAGVLQRGTAAAAEQSSLTDLVLNNARVLKGISNIRERARRDRRATRRAVTNAAIGTAFSAVTLGMR